MANCVGPEETVRYEPFSLFAHVSVWSTGLKGLIGDCQGKRSLRVPKFTSFYTSEYRKKKKKLSHTL